MLVKNVAQVSLCTYFKVLIWLLVNLCVLYLRGTK